MVNLFEEEIHTGVFEVEGFLVTRDTIHYS
jgi:hypothetical protein